MKMSFFFALIVSFALVFSIDANAQSEQEVKDEVRAMLEDRDEVIKELVGPEGTEYTAEQRQELMDIINEVIDYGAMAQHALQDTWDELSAEDREEFVDIFARIIRDQSLNSLDIYRADVTYESFEVHNDRVTARSIATLQNVRTPVIYELENRDGEWIVIDMSIDSVSTAESYRRSFQRIINRRGYDALLENLKNRAGVS